MLRGVAHRNGPDYGICGLLELLASFRQNGFLMTSPLEGESENCLVFIGDEWWAWVDLNHRPRPYQGLLWCYMHSIIFMRRCSWRSGREWEYRMNRNLPRVAYLRVKPRQLGLPHFTKQEDGPE